MVEGHFTRHTKIVCTLGPASTRPDVLRRMIAAGMDVARINLSHGTPVQHREAIGWVRALAREMRRPISILADLQGPKLRIGNVQPGGVELEAGATLLFDTDDETGSVQRIPVPSPDFFDLVQPGDRVAIDDGLLEFQVLAVNGSQAEAVVLHGGTLQDRKGINLLNPRPHASALTDKDREDLTFALAQKVDWIALSFVQSPDHVQEAKDLIRQGLAPHALQTPVVAKIEKPAALETIDDILALADGIMIARGDLAIETRTELVPLIQKELIQKCNQRGKPVITATQMLDSMVANPRPTRAEASDVANAVIDGTDGIMLSAETTVGSDPALAVRTMADIVRATEAQFPSPMPDIDAYVFGVNPIAASVAKSIVHIVDEVEASAILTPTATGFTAKMLAGFRPNVPILALTAQPQIERQLSLYRSVHAFAMPDLETSEEMMQNAIDLVSQAGVIEEGDRVVLTAGTIMGVAGMTNMMTVRTVVKPLVQGAGAGRRRVLGRCLHYQEDGPEHNALDLEDAILVMPEFSPHSVAIASACAGLVTTARRSAVEAHLPPAHRRNLSAIFEAQGDFNHLHNGQLLILDAVSGRLFDYKKFSAM